MKWRVKAWLGKTAFNEKLEQTFKILIFCFVSQYLGCSSYSFLNKQRKSDEPNNKYLIKINCWWQKFHKTSEIWKIDLSKLEAVFPQFSGKKILLENNCDIKKVSLCVRFFWNVFHLFANVFVNFPSFFRLALHTEY